MNPLFHLVTALVIYAILGPKKPLVFLFFLSSAFLLDLDHYLYYVFAYQDLNIFHALSYFDSIRHTPRAAFAFFHTVEFLFLSLILIFPLPKKSKAVYLWFLIGLLLHLLTDLSQGIFYDRVNYRWWSVLHWLTSR